MKMYIKSAKSSYSDVYDLAWQLRRISRPYQIGEVDAPADECYSVEAAVEALIWYVSTGRSYRDFDMALKKANFKKMIAFMVRDSKMDTSYDELIKSAKKYLSRYYGMPKD